VPDSARGYRVDLSNLAGLVAATLVGGVALVYGWHWNRLWLNPLWYVFLEPVRGCFVYYVARRY